MTQLTGYFANKDRHTKVHIVDVNHNPICGTVVKKDMSFQWNSRDVHLAYVECSKCRSKYLNPTKAEFKKGDKIIWDSNSGYEIGYFVGEGVLGHTYQVNLLTGVITGNVSHSRGNIKPYSEALVEVLSKKYGYTKKF